MAYYGMVSFADVVLFTLPSIGELASSPTIGHDLHIVYTHILIG